jgi:hypothetical protein
VSNGSGAGFVAGGVLAVVVCVVGLIMGIGLLTSYKNTDPGEVCVVREGGLFDGKAVIDVRQPGEGRKFIGLWNHQDCLPSSERDSNDVLEGDPKFPTRDSILMIADAQILFSLTTDPKKIKTFYEKYGRRAWGGESITREEGWINFLRQRFSPVVFDAYRQTFGATDCTALNNLCQYVLDPEKAAKQGQVKKVDNNQQLGIAQTNIAATLKQRLKDAFGDEYFENIRVQNLRPRFDSDVQSRITKAQALRTEAANAQLQAAKDKQTAIGRANAQREKARGERDARFLQAEGLNRYAKALRNPRVAEVEKFKALCGVDENDKPTGCQNLQVLGGSSTKLLK